MADTEERLRDVEITQAQQAILMKDLAETVKEVHKAVFSATTSEPGLSFRVARQEAITRNAMRFIVWTVSGGLLSIIGTLLLLKQILSAVEHLPPAGP